jgi:hypothetical protein
MQPDTQQNKNPAKSAPSPMPPPADEPQNTAVTDKASRWINSAAAQAITFAFGIYVVVVAGNKIDNPRATEADFLRFYAAVGLTALFILYYGFVAKVITLGKFRREPIKGDNAKFASIILLALLAIIAYQFVRAKH